MQTSEVGNYTITNLPPGNYDLTAGLDGFQKYTKSGIVLRVSQILRSDVQLEIGVVTESVTVDASIVAINTESGTIKGPDPGIHWHLVQDLLNLPVEDFENYEVQYVLYNWFTTHTC